MTIHLIAAIARNSVIGNQGGIPWHIPADLQHFKELTMGHTVVMGRRTYESIGGPLPRRQNIVVTTTKTQIPGCQTARSFKEALHLAEQPEIFILGGAMLYAQALPMADQLNLTFVDDAPEGDTRFPSVDWNCYDEVERESHMGEPAYTYVTYRRRK